MTTVAGMSSEFIALLVLSFLFNLFMVFVVVSQSKAHNRVVSSLLRQLDESTRAGFNGVKETARLIKARDVNEVVQAATAEAHADDPPALSGLTDAEEAEQERELEIQRVKDPHFDGPPPRNFRHPQFDQMFTNAPLVLEEEEER
jgi:hypothetical protein